MKQYTIILACTQDSEVLELKEAPRNWSATKFNVLRDRVYFGMLKTVSVEFQFVGESFKWLQRKRLLYGVDADIQIMIYYRDQFIMRGKLNQEAAQEDRKLKLYKCDILQSAAIQDFTNREDIELNIFNTISLDRLPISPAERKPCSFQGFKINFNSKFKEPPPSDEPYKYHHIVPYVSEYNGNPNVQIGAGTDSVTSAVAVSEMPEELKRRECAIIVNRLPDAQIFNVHLDLKHTAAQGYFENIGGFNKPGWRLIIRKLNAENVVVDTLWETPDNIMAFGVFNHIVDLTTALNPGEYVVFSCEQLMRFGSGSTIVYVDTERDFVVHTYEKVSITIVQDSALSPTTHNVVLPFELFTNLVKQINGGIFESEFFGRTDVGYAIDGPGAYVALTKGEFLRGVTADIQLTTSFRKAFQSYSCLFCLGAVFTEKGVRIEPLDKLITNQLATDIGAIDNFLLMPARDYLFNSVKAGYPIQEYEENNGRDEFNTTYQYSNSLRAVKQEWDLVSKFYGDGYGIEFARRASVINTGTADTRYDSKIFFICCKPTENGLVTKTVEDVLLVEGIFNPETAYNLDIAVGQNMIRNGKFLNVPLHRKTKMYFFQSKDKNTALKLTTFLGTTNDGEDLSLSNKAYFIPEERSGNAQFTLDMLFDILRRPLGVIAYENEGEQFYDLLLEVNAEKEKAMATWKFLGTRSSPPLVDPDIDDGPYLMWKSEEGAYIKYKDGDKQFIKYKNNGGQV